MDFDIPGSQTVYLFFSKTPEPIVEFVKGQIFPIVPYVFSAASAVFLFSGVTDFFSEEWKKKGCLQTIAKVSFSAVLALGSVHYAENKAFLAFAFLTPLLLNTKSHYTISGLRNIIRDQKTIIEAQDGRLNEYFSDNKLLDAKHRLREHQIKDKNSEIQDLDNLTASQKKQLELLKTKIELQKTKIEQQKEIIEDFEKQSWKEVYEQQVGNSWLNI